MAEELRCDGLELPVFNSVCPDWQVVKIESKTKLQCAQQSERTPEYPFMPKCQLKIEENIQKNGVQKMMVISGRHRTAHSVPFEDGTPC